MSISQCHRIYQEARARRRGDYDLKKHRDEALNDIEDLSDYLRPFVLGDPTPPDLSFPPSKNLIGEFLKTIKAERELLGLDAPKQSQVVSQNAGPKPVDSETAEYVGRLAAWARRTNAINADGYSPALPPG